MHFDQNNQVMLFLKQCKGIPKTILNRVVHFQWAGSAYWTRRKLGAKPKEKEVKMMLFQEFLLLLRKSNSGWKSLCSFAVGAIMVAVEGKMFFTRTLGYLTPPLS